MERKTKTYLGLAAVAVLVGWGLGDPAYGAMSLVRVFDGWGTAATGTLSFFGNILGGA